MTAAAANTMRFMAKGRLVVFVNLDRTPTDAEWNAYHAAVLDAGRTYGVARVLVFSEGGAPTAKQRKRAGELTAVIKSRTAVVSDSFIARSIVTALGWLRLDIKGFARAEQAKAFAFLELSSAESEWALRAVQEMQTQLREARV